MRNGNSGFTHPGRADIDGGNGDHEVRVAAHKTVFGQIEALDFILCGYAKAVDFFDDEEDDRHRNNCPESDCANAERLCAELGQAAAVEQAFCTHAGRGVGCK